MSSNGQRYEVVNTETGETISGPFSTIEAAEADMLARFPVTEPWDGREQPYAVSVVYEPHPTTETPLAPGDLVRFEDPSTGETRVLPVSRTKRQEPWLGVGAFETVELVDERAERHEHLPIGDVTGPLRCTCCDGPDGRGVHHVVGVDGLRQALDASGPFSVEDSLGRTVVELADAEQARTWLADDEAIAWGRA